MWSVSLSPRHFVLGLFVICSSGSLFLLLIFILSFTGFFHWQYRNYPHLGVVHYDPPLHDPLMSHDTSTPLDLLPIFAGGLYCQSLTDLAFLRVVLLLLACGTIPKINHFFKPQRAFNSLLYCLVALVPLLMQFHLQAFSERSSHWYTGHDGWGCLEDCLWIIPVSLITILYMAIALLSRQMTNRHCAGLHPSIHSVTLV
jgi:hypothetical protein